MRKLLYLFLFISLALPAQTFYVNPGSPNANDTHAGTDPAAPWATLNGPKWVTGMDIKLSPGVHNYSLASIPTAALVGPFNATIEGIGTLPSDVIVQGMSDADFTGGTATCGQLIFLNNGTITIKNLTLKNARGIANGGIIRGNTTSANLVLQNVTIQNASVSGTNINGGAISSLGALTCTNVSFDNCTTPGATGSGGAVFIQGGSSTFTGCSFTNNSAGKFGGAVDFTNATNPLNTITLSFSGCYFYNNTGGVQLSAATPGGGAINITNTTAPATGGMTTNLNIDNSTFSSNQSNYSSSALFVSCVAGTTPTLNMTLSNNVFYQNIVRSGSRAASGQGATINITATKGLLMGELYMVNNTFYGNQNADNGATNVKSIFMNDQNMDFAFINNLFFDNGLNNSFVFQSGPTTTIYKSFAFKNNFYDSLGGSINDSTATTPPLILASIANGNSRKVVGDILFGTALQQSGSKYYLPILPGSPAINAGINSFLLNGVNIVPQTDILGTPIVQNRDLGAYETSVTAIRDIIQSGYSVYPTLFTNVINLPTETASAELYDVTGKITLKCLAENKILTTNLKSGVYFVRVTLKSGEVYSSKLLKQ